MNLFQKLGVIFILVLSGAAGFYFSFSRNPLPQFTPPEEVGVIQTFHYPALFAEQLKHDKKAGEKIFNQFCTSCHGKEPIIDVPAPRIGDKSAWNLRRKMGMDALFKITTTGVGAMPARGGCFECTDDELRETILYILNYSQ